jgi:hypothetical protein
MSYIADQFSRIGLHLDYENNVPVNKTPADRVSVRFNLGEKFTNNIGISNSDLAQIYRILSGTGKKPELRKAINRAYKKAGFAIMENRRRGLRRNPEKGPSDYYYKLLRAKVPMDSHESDLYVKDTPTARAILADWPFGRLERFKNNINGQIYIDIPFAYAPYWKKKIRR